MSLVQALAEANSLCHNKLTNQLIKYLVQLDITCLDQA